MEKIAPPKAQLTVWLACLGKLKTGKILYNRGIFDQVQALCPLCGVELETNNHLLFTCHFSWNTWIGILESWEIKGVMQYNCCYFITAWRGLIHKKRLLWMMIFFYVLRSMELTV